MKKQAVIDYEKQFTNKKIPTFRSGDTVSVKYRIEEGGKERIQTLKGTIIARRGEGMGKSFTLRKITQGFGFERTFPLYSPFIEEIKVEKLGKVRRAKLYYLRERSGRATRIAERIDKQRGKTQEEAPQAEEAAAKNEAEAPAEESQEEVKAEAPAPVEDTQAEAKAEAPAAESNEAEAAPSEGDKKEEKAD